MDKERAMQREGITQGIDQQEGRCGWGGRRGRIEEEEIKEGRNNERKQEEESDSE